MSDNRISREQGSSGADEPLILIDLRTVRSEKYRHLPYLDDIVPISIDCSGARIGTCLAIGSAVIDTVYVNSRKLLAYVPLETLVRSEKHRVCLLG